MNAALYIRVSTEDQLELSPDSQKKLLLEYAKKNGLIVEDEHIFMDEGISGRKAEKRPAFMQMIALAKKKEKAFHKILVWKFSRFARNQEESMVYKNMLKKDGIEVVSISEPIIDGPFGSLIERIIEWMDEYYSVRLSSEVTRGMKEKARRGGVQSSPVLGYDIIDNKYVINTDEVEIVRKAFDMIIQGDTSGVIAKHFNSIGYKNKRGNLFTGRVIRYMIQNPVYYGMIRWNYATQQGTGRKVNPEEDWIISKGAHEPIICEEVWQQANSMLISRPTTSRPVSTGYRHWLGGLLRCASCGGTLTFGTTHIRRNDKVYTCSKFGCNNYIKGKCDSSNSISIKKIEKEIFTLLEETCQALSTESGFAQLNVRIDVNTSEQELLNNTSGVIAKHFNSIGYKNKRGNLFTGRVIRYMIQNPVYYGMVRWNYATQQGTGRKVNPEEDWIISKGAHEPIISEEVWQQANSMLISKPTTSRPISTGYRHWLGGLLRCASCGGTLTFGTTHIRRNDKVYTCSKFGCNNYIKGKCDSSNSISIKKIEKEIFTLLEETCQALSTESGFAQLNVRIDVNTSEQELLNKQLENLSKKLLKAKEAYLAEVDTLEEYKQNKNRIEAEKNTILEKLKTYVDTPVKTESLYKDCKNALELIKNPNATIEDKNKVLKKFIDCIKYDKKRETLDLFMFYNYSSI